MLYSVTLTISRIPYSGKSWRKLNLATWQVHSSKLAKFNGPVACTLGMLWLRLITYDIITGGTVLYLGKIEVLTRCCTGILECSGPDTQIKMTQPNLSYMYTPVGHWLWSYIKGCRDRALGWRIHWHKRQRQQDKEHYTGFMQETPIRRLWGRDLPQRRPNEVYVYTIVLKRGFLYHFSNYVYLIYLKQTPVYKYLPSDLS